MYVNLAHSCTILRCDGETWTVSIWQKQATNIWNELPQKNSSQTLTMKQIWI